MSCDSEFAPQQRQLPLLGLAAHVIIARGGGGQLRQPRGQFAIFALETFQALAADSPVNSGRAFMVTPVRPAAR